ncbi:MAG: S-layer family protein [Alkalinema sp. RU_4_3]|nr:S-layer family protein [Alkalinema sp. RU_4_3]
MQRIEMAEAQSVIPDTSLNTIVNSANNRDFTITGGGVGGNNLFHSFSQFSVPLGGSALFNYGSNINNIFARVTGETVSQIDGLIQGQGKANLFLLNPNGIIFGPNASLNLGGSFMGTTASSIQFADGMEFSAVNPMRSPLLTISSPVGLRMGENLAAIQVQGLGHRLAAESSLLNPYQPYAPYNALQVQPNQTLALIGGNIDLIGGSLQAMGARIELGSLDQPGWVALKSGDQGFSAQYTDIKQFGTINLAQQSSIEVGGLNPGNVKIQGGIVNIQDGSLIYNTNFGPQAGTIAISADQRLSLQGAIPNVNVLGGIIQDNFGGGDGGNIIVQTPELFARAGGAIFSRNYGSGEGALVTLNTDHLMVTGYALNAPEVFSRIGSLATAQGKGGDLVVSTRSLIVTTGGFMGSVNFFDGIGAGDVRVNADRIEVEGASPVNISSAIGSYNLARSGRSGNLTVNSRMLHLSNGGLVATSSISAGDAGNLLINASEAIEVNGYGSMDGYDSAIASSVSEPLAIYQQLFGLPKTPSGQGGNLQINTPSLSLSDGGSISVANYGTNRAGTVQINATNLQVRNGAYITALSLSGDGGEIDINSKQILLNNLANIGARAFGSGNSGDGGNIKINSTVIVGANNSDVLADATQGRGGNISIRAAGIFGLKSRAQLTPQNDITASSQFGINGTVEVHTIGVNPNSGLITLPTDPLDPSQQVADGCRRYRDSRFIVTGRGGVPDHALKTILVDHAWLDLRAMAGQNPKPRVATAVQPIEATALTTNAQGQMELVGEGRSPLTQRA